jgi:hypothetical protein
LTTILRLGFDLWLYLPIIINVSARWLNQFSIASYLRAEIGICGAVDICVYYSLLTCVCPIVILTDQAKLAKKDL